MTQREYRGGGESTSDQQQNQLGNVKQQLQGAAEQIGDSAREVLSDARGALSHAQEKGAQFYSEARDAAGEQYRTARDYAMEEAQMLRDRARHAGEVGAEYARRAGESTGQFVSNNALPLALIGAGIGWLAWSMRNQSMQSRGFYRDSFDDDFDEHLEGEYPIRERMSAGGTALGDRVGEFADQARQRAHSLTERATQTAHDLADRATQGASAVRTRMTDAAVHYRQQAGELSHQAAERARMASQRTREFADENPLLVGALAVAAGVGVGLLLPNTQPENRWLGQTRDRLFDDARSVLDDARATATQTASEIGRGARETAQDIGRQVSDSRISH